MTVYTKETCPDWIKDCSTETLSMYYAQGKGKNGPCSKATAMHARAELLRRSEKRAILAAAYGAGPKIREELRKQLEEVVMYGITATKVQYDDIYTQVAQEVKMQTKEQLYKELERQSLTPTQRPLYEMLRSAQLAEEDARRTRDQAKAHYIDRRQQREAIEADLKKLGWRPVKRS